LMTQPCKNKKSKRVQEKFLIPRSKDLAGKGRKILSNQRGLILE
jgi:hypothetical protein